MKNLEDQLKETFDHFEPEVDSSVWTKVSSSIATPPSSSVVSAGKTATSFIGSTASWIAAAIAIVVGGTLIYFSQAKKSVDSSINNDLENNDFPKENTSVNNEVGSSDKNADFNSGLKSTSQNNKFKSDNTTNLNSKNNTDEIVNHTDDFSNKGINSELKNEQNQGGDKSSGITNNESTIETKSSIASQNLVENTQPITDEKAVTLMVSNKIGFAPLKVTAQLSNEKVTADFDFGDGTIEYKQSVATHIFEDEGTYTINCTFNGKEISETVKVLGQLATAFSPNGDGINDQYNFGGNEIQLIEVRVYNRNGKTIYTGKSKSLVWDGNLSDGNKAEPGTYFYDIFATSVEGMSFKQKGTINLFR